MKTTIRINALLHLLQNNYNDQGRRQENNLDMIMNLF